jgi:hypothetical protein
MQVLCQWAVLGDVFGWCAHSTESVRGWFRISGDECRAWGGMGRACANAGDGLRSRTHGSGPGDFGNGLDEI